MISNTATVAWGWWKQRRQRPVDDRLPSSGDSPSPEASIPLKKDGVLPRGARSSTDLVEEEKPDLQAWMLHALAVQNGQKTNCRRSGPAFENRWTNREKFNAYTRALFALAAHQFRKNGSRPEPPVRQSRKISKSIGR